MNRVWETPDGEPVIGLTAIGRTMVVITPRATWRLFAPPTRRWGKGRSRAATQRRQRRQALGIVEIR